MSHLEVADTLERFVEGKSGRWEWDDFMSAAFPDDPDLRSIQERMSVLSMEFPPSEAGHYCSAEGLKVIRGYVDKLKSMGAAPK